ncbi:MAG: formylglycine-generating enzyme family protein, partial [Planctomycetia bacterium]|nr:formylglycine-generating enzyme family protein [Planctomycetia bacterium]
NYQLSIMNRRCVILYCGWVLVLLVFLRVVLGAAEESSTSATIPQPGERMTQTIEGVEFAFRWCPSGIFYYPNDGTLVKFRVEGFWMSETEVTQAQWKAIMGNNPAHFKSDETRPVEQVNWYDANQFCEKMSELMQCEATLPNGLQWLYAYCAGKPFSTEEKNLSAKAWFNKNSEGKTHPVGKLAPNGWGLYDMSGNVWEWCSECRNYNHRTIRPRSPEQKDTEALHFGGSWYGVSTRLDGEHWRAADWRIYDVGFRFCFVKEGGL